VGGETVLFGFRRGQPIGEGAMPLASPDLIELALRTPRDGIFDPAVDVGFAPAGSVGADLDLRRERALGDLTVDGDRDSPIRERTVFKRTIRSGSRMAALVPAGCF
jgi:hypothetical protein